jgi:antitoxin (DNA-binding transcriptional repressor) of toxin-antitoxin stability system
MQTITIHKAKTQLSRLIEKACKGEEIVIARGKQPEVRLVAINHARGDRKLGALKGKIRIGPEFLNLCPRKNWKAGESNTQCAFLLTRMLSLWWVIRRSPVDPQFPPFTANPRRFFGLR